MVCCDYYSKAYKYRELKYLPEEGEYGTSIKLCTLSAYSNVLRQNFHLKASNQLRRAIPFVHIRDIPLTIFFLFLRTAVYAL